MRAMKHHAPPYRALVALLVGLWCGTAWAGQPPGPPYGGPADTLTTLGRTLAAQHSDRINVKDFGATGNGTTDDSPAITAAINRCLSVGALGQRMAIYFPAGTYRIVETLPVINGVPCGVIGDGVTRSIIAPDITYSGDVLAFSNTWGAPSSSAYAYNLTTIAFGSAVRNIGIQGNLNATNTQTGIHFYDRNQEVLLENVDVQFLHGSGIILGDVLNTAFGYVSESSFVNIRLANVGISGGAAAMEITGSGTGDSTNQLYFDNLNIFSNGPSLRIRNANTTGKALGPIRFSGLRVEHPLTASVGDSLIIGDLTMAGGISSIYIDHFIGNASYAGSATIKLLAASSASAPFDVRIKGGILTGAGTGIDVEAGSNLSFEMSQIVASTDLVVAAQGLVGHSIALNLNNLFNSITTSIDPTSLPYVRASALATVGDPATGILGVTAYPHDGSTKYGDSIGAGSVDLIGGRGAHNQAVTGTYSLGVGNNVTVACSFCIAAGNLNVTGGSATGAVVFGQSNTVTGAFSALPGGLRTTDRGRYGYEGWGSGYFGGPGDAQSGKQLLRGIATAATAIYLLADGTTTLAGVNNVFIPPGAHYHLAVSATCHDYTTSGWATWDVFYGDLDRGTIAAPTTATYSGSLTTATAPTRSGGTLTSVKLTAAADATNQGLLLTITPPTGNTDTIHCMADVDTREEVQ
jgi:hypothetical protein